jgi:hypothetical protein
MAIEWVDVISWIYKTLSEDDVLAELLAGTSKVKGFQQAVYTDMAPQVDPISGQSPLAPFVIVALADGGVDERSLCGSRFWLIQHYALLRGIDKVEVCHTLG